MFRLRKNVEQLDSIFNLSCVNVFLPKKRKIFETIRQIIVFRDQITTNSLEYATKFDPRTSFFVVVKNEIKIRPCTWLLQLHAVCKTKS